MHSPPPSPSGITSRHGPCSLSKYLSKTTSLNPSQSRNAYFLFPFRHDDPFSLKGNNGNMKGDRCFLFVFLVCHTLRVTRAHALACMSPSMCAYVCVFLCLCVCVSPCLFVYVFLYLAYTIFSVTTVRKMALVTVNPMPTLAPNLFPPLQSHLPHHHYNQDHCITTSITDKYPSLYKARRHLITPDV